MKFFLALAAFVQFGGQLQAVEIVSEGGPVACREITLKRALTLYRDPEVFLASTNSHFGEEFFEESPILTELEKGTVQWMELGPAKALRNTLFRRFYEQKRRGARLLPRGDAIRIIPIKLCGGRYDAYRDTLGFVVESDLKFAQLEDRSQGGLPPSVLPNPVPNYLP